MEMTKKGNHSMNRTDYEGQFRARSHALLLWITREMRRPDSKPAAYADAGKSSMRKALLLTAALALVSAMSVVSARAQDRQILAHIPFAFKVGSSTLPAGDYSLERLGQAQYVWLVRNDHFQAAVLAQASIDGTNMEENSAVLVFHHYGDAYFLSQIQYPGETYALPASKAEQEMARDNAKPQSLDVVASL
jgi:hypothetical protein